MTTTTTQARITLALAACAGLSDAELAERGAEGFKKMIERKRKYAASSRLLALAVEAAAKAAKKADAEVAALKRQLATAQTLAQLDAPVTDTTEAAAYLAKLGK